MSNKTRKGSFHSGECLDLFCSKKGPHYHNEERLNMYNVGPTSSHNNNRNKAKTRKAMLNSYVGINEKRVMKNTIKSWKARNRKLAMNSLKNNKRM